MGQFTREFITEELAKFEKRHNVDNYEIYGTAIWPIVRISIATALHAGVLPSRSLVVDPSDGATPSFAQHCRHIFLSYKRRLKTSAKKIELHLSSKRKKHLGRVPVVEVVIVTAANRRVNIGNSQYNTVVEPLKEALKEEKISTLVWERGGSSETMQGGPSWSYEDERFRVGLIPQEYSEHLLTPPWFNDIYDWLLEKFDIKLPWNFLEWRLRRMFYFSSVVKKWLRKTDCKLVITDCWYNQDCISFVHAASELGLETMDFQHGLQGVGHFAYQEWLKVPLNGYSLVPNKFWVWCREDAENLLNGGPQQVSQDDVIIGGNLWLNKWRTNDDAFILSSYLEAKEISSDFSAVVVVTLQKDIDNWKQIRDAIEVSSRDWLWMVRAHRHEVENLSKIQEYFEVSGHPGIRIRKATEIPLYTLFQIADIHVTGYSTCALEALAFNVPTILIHRSGRSAYRSFLDNGAMIFAKNSDELINYAEKIVNNQNNKIFTASADVFVFHKDLKAILSNLIN